MTANRKVACPACQAEIPLADVNVSADLALCRRCGKTSSFSNLLDLGSTSDIDLTRPPKGAWFQRKGHGFEVGVSTRSPIALFLVPFMCLWSGGSLGGIYGSQIMKGEFNPFMSLFGLPFLVGTIFLGGLTLLTVCGKSLISVDGSQATLFTGVGSFGFRKKFDWSAVTGIRRTRHVGRRNSSEQITIDADRPINFGTGLSEARLNFMLGALRLMHKEHR